MSGWLSGSRVPLVAALLAIALASPALGIGYVLDDHVHQSMLRDDIAFPEAVDPVWGLFAFMDGTPARNRRLMDIGIFPWWTEPTLRAQFLRPVTALTHLLDHRVAPTNAVFAHAHSLLWLGLVVLLAGHVYRRLLGPSVAAGLATLMFAVEDAHGVPAAWIANRNALIALAFGLATVALHDEGYRRGRRGARWAAPLGLLAALLSAEAAVGTMAYLVAYALFLPHPVWMQPRAGRLLPRLVERLCTVAPYVVVLAGWKIVHAAGGYGASGSGLYLDPIAEPAAFWSAALVRVPALLFAQWTPVPSELALVASGWARPLLAAVSAAATVALIGWTWRATRGSPVVGMLLAGSVLAAVPVSAAFSSNRLLVFVGVGVFGAVGALFEGWWRDRGGFGARLVVGLLVVTHVVLAPVGSLAAAPVVRLIGAWLPEQCARATAADAPLEGKTLVFVNAHALCAAYVGPSRATQGSTQPRHVRVLASVFDDVEVTRLGPRVLQVRVPGGYQRHPIDRLMRRASRPIPVGGRVALSGFTAEVKRHNAAGLMEVVQFRFDRPLDDPTLLFFALDDEGARTFEVPAVGATVWVTSPWSPDSALPDPEVNRP